MSKELVQRARELCERTPVNPDEWDIAQGDSVQRRNPSARQMLNHNVAWIIGPTERSALRARARKLDLLDRLQLVPDLATALEDSVPKRKLRELFERWRLAINDPDTYTSVTLCALELEELIDE